MNAFAAAVVAVLVAHIVWLLWVILGAFFTRGHPLLTALHLAALVWGIIVEVGPWPCPLTLAEEYFKYRAGIPLSGGSLLVRCLDALVYPDVPELVLVWIGVAVCAANLLVYGWRLWKWHRRSVHP